MKTWYRIQRLQQLHCSIVTTPQNSHTPIVSAHFWLLRLNWSTLITLIKNIKMLLSSSCNTHIGASMRRDNLRPHPIRSCITTNTKNTLTWKILRWPSVVMPGHASTADRQSSLFWEWLLATRRNPETRLINKLMFIKKRCLSITRSNCAIYSSNTSRSMWTIGACSSETWIICARTGISTGTWSTISKQLTFLSSSSFPTRTLPYSNCCQRCSIWTRVKPWWRTLVSTVSSTWMCSNSYRTRDWLLVSRKWWSW